MVKRFYVEKKKIFDVESKNTLDEIKTNLDLQLSELKIITVYDIEGLSDKDEKTVVETILSEPNVDYVYKENPVADKKAIRIQLLPGQFDQRASSAMECVQIVTLEKSQIESSKLYVFSSNISDAALEKIKEFLVNPVESQIVPVDTPDHLVEHIPSNEKVPLIEGFIDMEKRELENFLTIEGFAMDLEDIQLIQNYFIKEKRNPTITELKVLDTYWSDHCRHTTFLTKLTSIEFEQDNYIKDTFNRYLEIREELNRTKDICLMDLGTIMAKYQRYKGNLDNLDISEEINACSIEVPVTVDGIEEDYLVMFKNETHNHPTEIEPFGGASTCLGGAIRDPLSGRAYVYQGMRVTGAADPTQPISQTLPGKLPQKVITTKAAHGFSSYGNQIGLATGLIDEFYHPNFVAKRMEVGAVVGATPKKDVNRMTPVEGDLILLIGGKTGRDGCGGATGSSKKHDESSIETSGAEVQRGNAPEERKLQRLYRNSEFSKRIKRCNDFGAGGVSVAVGELADSITVKLDQVPKKYQGLTGTELAISESQERMAIVIDKHDLEQIKSLCYSENVEATIIAEVTSTGRFIMTWQGEEIFNIKRDFLEENGAVKENKVYVEEPKEKYFTQKNKSVEKQWIKTLSDLNVCSKKGLVEMFDNTIGASTVLMPFGGEYRQTPTQTMVAKIPVEAGETNNCTIMTYGYDPDLGMWSPYHAGVYNVLSSVSKIVATGGKVEDIRLSFQEYFERLGDTPEKWGKPFAAILGTLEVLDHLNLAAIGGKDSMSGTFEDIDVPPTLISFALAPSETERIISPEFKEAGNYVYRLSIDKDGNELPNLDRLKEGYDKIFNLIGSGDIVSAYSITKGGLAEALSKMAFGNKIGVKIINDFEYFKPNFGEIIFESQVEIHDDIFEKIGETLAEYLIELPNQTIEMEAVEKAWEEKLDSVFPRTKTTEGNVDEFTYTKKSSVQPKQKIKTPKVFIPAFPGTNCEYDTLNAFEKVGAKGEIIVFNNQGSTSIEKSIDKMVRVIKASQIIAIPGGFSAGDEPAGSGKFIASVFRNKKMKAAVHDLLNNRDGLIIGICNGFQALVKLGLLPDGEIHPLTDESPTLTFNTIGRHISKISKIKVASKLSPWLKNASMDEIYETPMSHGEGRFYAEDEVLKKLIENGQVATRYVDANGNPTMDGAFNPNGSVQAIEGITSRDGRVFGKMGHVERLGNGVLKNIYNKKDMAIFRSGVEYFKNK